MVGTPLSGLVGAFAVIAGLLFVGKVGAGAFAGLTITANILMSLAVDPFGMFGMEVNEFSTGPMGGANEWGGIALISKF
jgi:bacterial/archaeal transporter family-2 protein